MNLNLNTHSSSTLLLYNVNGLLELTDNVCNYEKKYFF